jgi:hypothetical protein
MAQIFSQTDTAFTDKHLGDSGLRWHDFGCTATCVLNALTDAGYHIDPSDFANSLDNACAFTDQGLLLWSVVSSVYPQFHFGNGSYQFLQGTWNKFQHWVLVLPNGVELDPWYGLDRAPAGFNPTGVSRYASIDPYVAPEPTPEPTPAPDPVPQVSTYTVQQGDTLGHIIAQHYGLDSWAQISAKIPEVCQSSGINDANFITVGQLITLP